MVLTSQWKRTMHAISLKKTMTIYAKQIYCTEGEMVQSESRIALSNLEQIMRMTKTLELSISVT